MKNLMGRQFLFLFSMLLILAGMPWEGLSKTSILKTFSRTSQERIEKGEVVTNAEFTSVNVESSTEPHRKMDVKSGGGFFAPMDTVWEKVNDFEQYDKVLPFVKKTDWDSKKRLLSISAGIMMIKLDSVIYISDPQNKDRIRKFHWEVKDGDLKGSKGELICEKHSIGTVCALLSTVIQKRFLPSETLFGMAVETGLTKVTEKMKRISELENVDDF